MRNKNKNKKNRWISWILTLAMLCSLLQTSAVPAFAADAAGGGVNISGATKLKDTAAEITTGGIYTIGATRTSALKIDTTAPVTLLLDGVTITTPTSPIELVDGAKVTLVVPDGTNNTLTCTATAVNAANSGKTAGILVPETASLTIDRASGDTGTGTLTVTGGYGGAGIGGAATQGYANVRGAKGTDGGDGSDGAWDVADIKGTAGAKGIGGQGGFYGQSATNAGTIIINAGTVNAIGCQGGAGIGGGRGGNGENGQVGNNGTSGTEGKATRRWNTGTYKSQRTDCGASGSAGGGGAGGNGGNGGAGGNGGVVAIKGGTVTAEGKDGAAGIGGGAGGNGGNGGNGGSGGARVGNQNTTVANHFDWNDVYWYPGIGGAGGNGAGGYGGTGGAGGAGGQLTITGGKVQSNGYTGFGGGSVGAAGTKGNGTQTNGENSTNAYFWYAKGGSNSWSNQHYGHWYGNNAEAYYSRAAGPGGNGGAAGAQAQANSDGAAGTMQITSSNANVDFVSTGGGALTNGSPTDKNNDPLYRVELTVFDLEKDSKIKGANVNVEVPGGNGKTAYTYKTVSETNGKAVVWLPAGTYKLEKKAVNHDTLGAIPKDQPVTLTVEANDNNKQDVLIGVSVKVSADKTDKVYFSNNSETPVTIRVDTSEIEQQITSVKWFRETIKDHEDTEYAPTNTGNKEAFDKRYGEIPEDSGNKGTLTKPTDGVYSLLINQNGRYWVQIEYTSNSVPVKLVKGLTVNNIYRTFDIQFRTEWWETVGGAGGTQKLIKSKPEGDGVYGPLLDSQGNTSPQKVGFAWELDGYDAADIQNGTLLTNPHGGFDKVKFYAQSTELSYNTAVLGTYTAFTQNDLVYTKDLDASFLKANNDCDQGDISKYTLKYNPKDAQLTLVTIYGRVRHGGTIDTDSKPLYADQRAYTPLINTDEIDGKDQTGYKLVAVRINGVDAPFVKDAQGGDTNLVKLENIHGSQTTDKIRTVEFIYENNMTDVTIRGYYQGTTTPIENFPDIKVQAEIGKAYTYGQLPLDGYDFEGTVPKLDTVSGNPAKDILTYYYTKKQGNVTYQLVDQANPNKILQTKTIQVQKGDSILADAAQAPTLTNWKLASQDNGVVVGADADGKYDGVHAVTVTYQAVPKTKTIIITRYDVDNNQKIPLSTAETQEGKTLRLEKETGKLYTISKADYLPANYTISGENEATVFVADDGNTEIHVNLYYRSTTDETVKVKLLYTDDAHAEHEFQSYVLLRKPGTSLDVKVPDLSAKGYEVDKTKTPQDTVTVQADTSEVKMYYKISYHEITVELVKQVNGVNTTDRIAAPAGFETTYKVRKSEGFTIAAPSIKGYTLKSNLIVSRTAEELNTEAKRKITFAYEETKTADFVTHTIVLMDTSETPNVEMAKYISLVEKKDDGSTTTYYAPGLDGYQVDANSKEAPNREDATVQFLYTKSAATIKVNYVDKNGKQILINGKNHEILTGYEKGQTVMITAPSLLNYALAGLWENNNVQNMTGVTHQLTLATDKQENEVTFAYEDRGNVNFVLKDAETNREIQVINGEVGKTYATTNGGALDLSASGWNFDASHTSNSSPFTTTESKSVTVATGTIVSYTLYYNRQKRNVQYTYKDVTDANNPTEITFTDTSNPAKIGVGELLIAVAPQIPGYTPVKLRKSIPVLVGNDDVEVTFEYVKKQTGRITVVHVVKDGTVEKTFMSYTASGSQGEWFTASALPRDNEGITTGYEKKYKFVPAQGNEETQSVQIGAAETVIKFVYEANYVKVNTYLHDGLNQQSYQDNVEVIKNMNHIFYPPVKTDYVLKGITITPDGGQPEGTSTSFPQGWDETSGALTLSNLTKNTAVVYSYAPMSESIEKYQVKITVNDKYESYMLGSRTEVVTKDRASEITPKQYAGYTLVAYQIGDSADRKMTIAPENASSFKLQETFTANTNVTFFYTRTDGSAVVPGGNGNLGDDDDVIIKPNGSDKPTFTDKPEAGSVKVPNGAEVVTPGGTVIPPDGSVVKPDGTIVVPDQDGNFNPGTTIDPAKPDQVAPNYLYIKYLPNGGKGEGFTQFFKAGNAVTVATNRFTADNKTADGWNTQEDGEGTDYVDKATINLTESLTLYAKWSKAAYKYKVKITFNSNNGVNSETKTQVIGTHSNKTFSGKLAANTFTINGWTFCGWNEEKDGSGKGYINEQKVAFTSTDSDLILYAQWYRFHADGSITVPGKDNTPNTDKDVTVHPNGDKPPALDKEGNIEVPSGGKVTTPDGTIIPPDGSIVKPDGTIVAPDDNGNREPGVTIDPSNPDSEAPTYFVVTYAYGIAGSNVQAVRQYGKGSLTILTASPFAAPAGKEFAGWTKDGQDFTDQTVDTSVTLTAKWKDSTGSGGNTGGGGGGGGSVIVIGGGGGSKVPQKPTIIVDENTKYELSEDGTAVTLITKDGYQVNSIIVNGEEKGGAEAITGLKTGDIVKISAICYLDVIEEAQSYRLVARSKLVKRKNGMHPVKVKVSWYDENGKELKLDGYEIERSRKRYTDYQLRFKTDRKFYYNTFIQDGAKYYYRVRGYILFNGQKYYTRWSKKAWRTVKM